MTRTSQSWWECISPSTGRPAVWTAPQIHQWYQRSGEIDVCIFTQRSWGRQCQRSHMPPGRIGTLRSISLIRCCHEWSRWPPARPRQPGGPHLAEQSPLWAWGVHRWPTQRVCVGDTEDRGKTFIYWQRRSKTFIYWQRRSKTFIYWQRRRTCSISHLLLDSSVVWCEIDVKVILSSP